MVVKNETFWITLKCHQANKLILPMYSSNDDLIKRNLSLFSETLPVPSHCVKTININLLHTTFMNKHQF